MPREPSTRTSAVSPAASRDCTGESGICKAAAARERATAEGSQRKQRLRSRRSTYGAVIVPTRPWRGGMQIEAHDPHHAAESDLQDKGLSHNSIGVVGSVVLGISSVAPAYALTATIGILVSQAGSKMAVVIIA